MRTGAESLFGSGGSWRDRSGRAERGRAERDGDDYVFSVRDNGIGVAEEHHEMIFGIFKRLHHPEDYPGSGMGLAVCRRIVLRHGGQIWVESELGKGSTFLFSMPKRMLYLCLILQD